MTCPSRGILFCAFLSSTTWGSPIVVETEVPQKDANPSDNTFDGIIKINEGLIDLFEGDIVLPRERNAIQDKTLKWNLTVPYSIAAQFSFEKRSKILSAFQELQVRTCINFVDRSTEVDYLFYEINNGCYSSVGKKGKKQIVSIGVGCAGHRTIIHETFHALGFWHEQSRTDRDEHVQIVWDVISEGKTNNFDKYETDKIDSQGVPYDYDSIMHYGNTAFSSNGSQTIIALSEGAENMGKLDAISRIDLQELNLLYECQESLDENGYTAWTEWSQCDINCERKQTRFCDGDQCTTWGEVQTQSSGCDSECEVGLDPDCGSKVISSGLIGSVSSPLFPYSYKSNAACTNTIQVPDGGRVRLSFQAMDVEDYQGGCYFDFVHIYDGADENSPKIGTYCSTQLPETIFSSGDTMTIKFISDSSVEKGGFYAEYYTVTAPIHSCSFEDEEDFCGWTHNTNAELTFEWNAGTTSSIQTGPSADHTFPDKYGHYLYLEASGPAANGNRAQIISPLFVPQTSESCFSFWYNMYGANTGSLNAYLMLNSSLISPAAVTYSGDKTDNLWYRSSWEITSTDPFQVAIEAVRGNGYKGDIGIDDVKLEGGGCP